MSDSVSTLVRELDRQIPSLTVVCLFRSLLVSLALRFLRRILPRITRRLLQSAEYTQSILSRLFFMVCLGLAMTTLFNASGCVCEDPKTLGVWSAISLLSMLLNSDFHLSISGLVVLMAVRDRSCIAAVASVFMHSRFVQKPIVKLSASILATVLSCVNFATCGPSPSAAALCALSSIYIANRITHAFVSRVVKRCFPRRRMRV